ncbi:hypothetical protein [Pontibacter flavimaris]|uniref:Uncharacterized protein n=1 Tax=Pontibacter flavimaris TaxID=1797110 RepID=A0A1Q5PCL2_9BACT|nr:hypothetical protein [Pontibacter flavimaris]OKL39989.1 hypothetical protein A3841_16640 [Pontibacter flavimaris]
MALRINFADYKSSPLSCPACGWKGEGKDTCQNAGGTVMDLECPNCFKMLAIISFPTYQETLNRGSEADRQAALREINFREKFRRMSLKNPDELPDIEGSTISFTFRSVSIKGEDYSIIEHQEQEIWREPMVWEGYGRFLEIGRILKARYGARMVDLVPDETAETFLYGDWLQASDLITAFRQQLRV